LIFIGGAFYLTLTIFAPWSFAVLGIFIFLFWKFQFRIFPVSGVIEKGYDKYFYGGKTLKDLNDKPVLAIGSSNLQTGRPFTFSKIKMSDSTYTSPENYNPIIRFNHENFPIARAVMASSCVPFAFTPVTISKEFYEIEDDSKRIYPVLVDGGVYDNQGIQKLTQPRSTYECEIIITSDAGGGFRAEKKYPNAFTLLIRTVDLFMYRIKAVQMVQHIYSNVGGAEKPIAYFSLGWKLKNLVPGFVSNMKKGQVLQSVIDAHKFKQEWIDHPGKYVPEITYHLEKNIGY
jgi:NTE family protein